MNSEKVCTIKNSHVQAALEQYLRTMKLIRDDEFIQLDTVKDFPLKIRKEQEVLVIEH